MLVYCDSNVYLDKLRDRDDPIRPLKTFAEEFFAAGENCSFELLVSDWLFDELTNHVDEAAVETVLKPFRQQEKLSEASKEAADEKRAQSFTNPDDALHAVIAERAGADVLVTRNVRDYTDIDFIKVKLPEAVTRDS